MKLFHKEIFLLVTFVFLAMASFSKAKESSSFEINPQTAETLFSDLDQIQKHTPRVEFRALLKDLSEFFRANNNLTKSIIVQEMLVQRVTGELGTLHESLLEIFKTLSQDYENIRDFKKSSRYHDAQWALWTIVNGFKNNPLWNHDEGVGIAMCDLADQYILMRRNAEAFYLLNKARGVFANLNNGMAHPKSMEAGEKIEALQQKMDKKYELDCSEVLN